MGVSFPLPLCPSPILYLNSPSLIVIFASSSVSFVSPGRLFNHSDGGPPQRWGSPRRRSSPYRHCIQSRLLLSRYLPDLRFLESCSHQLFARCDGGPLSRHHFPLCLHCIRTCIFHRNVSQLFIFQSSLRRHPQACDHAPYACPGVRVAGYQLYPNSPLSSVILLNSCISGDSGASRCVACIAFYLWQLLRELRSVPISYPKSPLPTVISPSSVVSGNFF